MQDVTGILVLVVILGGWIAICVAVGRAAAAKGRRATLWGLMAFIPLGPIMAPLWLASMPKVGEQATNGQLIGRSVLIILFVVSFLGRQAIKVNQRIEAEAMTKAEADYGFETEYVSKHYKKMSVDEIVECITLSKTSEQLQHEADYDEADETYYFDTQSQADIYNDMLARYNEMECGDRTYAVADLNKAMKIIENGP